MAQFKAKQIDILVSTTVIEVGIDVPNATIMVIENAERFGLGAASISYEGEWDEENTSHSAILVTTPKSNDSFERMKVMTRTSDGFEIAEADLRIRGSRGNFSALVNRDSQTLELPILFKMLRCLKPRKPKQAGLPKPTPA